MVPGQNPHVDSSSSTSKSLLERIRTYDAEAWARFSALYSPLVYSWCRACGLQAADAADVLQEVFQAVYRSVAAFRDESPTASFRGWLWTITRNKIRDHFRRTDHRPAAGGGTVANHTLAEIPDAEPPSDEPVTGANSLLRRSLELVEAEFESRTWQAFWRSTIDGIDTAIVAQELGITPSTVRTARSRIVRRLRQELKDLE